MMNWFMWLTTSAAIVVSGLSLLHFKAIFKHIDDLRQRHKMVPYMVLMCGWIILLAYGIAWLLWILHLAGLPIQVYVSWFFDFFVID